MNEKEQLFKFLRDTLNQTKDIAIDQAPLVMQEWAKMRMIQSLTSLLLCLIGIGIILFVIKKFLIKEGASIYESDNMEIVFLSSLICLALGTASVMGLIINTPIFFSAWLTPKAFLLQEFLR